METLNQVDTEALKKELARREASNKQERQAYKGLIEEVIPDIFASLAEASERLARVKAKAFEEIKSLIELKWRLYDIKSEQRSHTFTTQGGQSLTLGYRIVDAWDDTVGEGIAKVNAFLESLAVDERTGKLVKTIHQLLKKDAKGNLKANRVIELRKMANDFGDELLSEGVEIIMQSHRPSHSCYFIEADYVDGTGRKKNLPLSISTVDLPEGMDLSFLKPQKG